MWEVLRRLGLCHTLCVEEDRLQVLFLQDLPLLIKLQHYCFKTVLLFTYNLYLSVSHMQVLVSKGIHPVFTKYY